MTEHEMSSFTGADCYGPCCIREQMAAQEASHFASIDAMTVADLDALAAADYEWAEAQRAREMAPSPF